MKRVQILEPGERTEVAPNVTAVTIEGRAVPARVAVQLYVLAGDGKWYLQPRTVRFGSRFAGTVYLGDVNVPSPPAGSYQVVAVLTDARPGSPVEVLPAGQQSEPVIVVRTTPVAL